MEATVDISLCQIAKTTAIRIMTMQANVINIPEISLIGPFFVFILTPFY